GWLLCKHTDKTTEISTDKTTVKSIEISTEMRVVWHNINMETRNFAVIIKPVSASCLKLSANKNERL
ncbi:MAG: hypothetical protein LBE12_13565, partial [Planctomycetaceae bacterium]|nr:hypothetical protein [Planctomycetaceae bacterium]